MSWTRASRMAGSGSPARAARSSSNATMSDLVVPHPRGPLAAAMLAFHGRRCYTVAAISAYLILATSWVVFPQEKESYPSPPTLKELDQLKLGDDARGSLERLEVLAKEMVREKRFQCLRAFGDTAFCGCLSEQLPVGATFLTYVQIVGSSKEALGYSKLSADDKLIIDNALSAREVCVGKIRSSAPARPEVPPTTTKSADKDFPHASYMREVQRRIGEKWDSRARDGQQPVAVFQIGRDGQVGGLAIEKTSGNALYDLAALRAITEASPLPPLPPDFQGSWLRVHLGFGYAGTSIATPGAPDQTR